MTFSIVKATPEDLSILQKISVSTFTETFQELNTADNMKKYIDESLSYSKLKSELDNENSQFYFLKSEDQIAGYLKVNTGSAQTELKEENALEVERIYINKTFHGKGAGMRLINKAFDIAQQHGKEYVWLGVWEKNDKAIRFYKKFGFKEFAQHQFVLGDDVQTDIMMRLDIALNP